VSVWLVNFQVSSFFFGSASTVLALVEFAKVVTSVWLAENFFPCKSHPLVPRLRDVCRVRHG